MIEEFAHTYIHDSLYGVDNVSGKFTNSLMRIMRADPAIAQAVNEKSFLHRERL